MDCLLLSLCALAAVVSLSNAGLPSTSKLQGLSSEALLLAELSDRGLLEGGPDECGEALSSGDVVEHAIQQGYWDATLAMVSACKRSPNNKALAKRVYAASSSVRQRLTEVANLVRAPAGGAASQIVMPSFEWAQSRDTIFLNVKFSHKLDAPACIDLVDETVSIEKSEVKLGSTCKNKGKRFELEIATLKEIDPANSSWVGGSVGRGTLTLRKAVNNTRWARLFKDRDYKPKNMHIWWSMQEKYESEMKEVDRLVSESKSKDGDGTNDNDNAVKSDASSNSPAKSVKKPKKELTEEQKLQRKSKKEKKKIDKALSKKLKSLERSKKERIKEAEAKLESEKKEINNEHEDKVRDAKREAEESKKAVDERLMNKDSGSGILDTIAGAGSMLGAALGINGDKLPNDAAQVEAAKTTAAEAEIADERKSEL